MPKTMMIDLVEGVPKLLIRDIDRPEPGPGEVRYAVHAIGLNRADIMYLNGGHSIETVFPSRVAFEACGIIDAIGQGVTTVAVGDRVAAIPFGDPRYSVGGEFAITPARYIAPWPTGFSAAEAAGAWMQYMTAYYPLRAAQVGPGDAILVTAGSSSAGIGAIQLARLMGATVVVTTRTSAKKDFLLGVGADHVVVSDDGDVAGQILSFTGEGGVRMVYDAVAGPFMKAYAPAIGKDARIFIYGALGGPSTIECDILPLIRRNATIGLHSLINVLQTPGAVDEGRLFIGLAMEAGALRPVIDRVFPFEQAVEAYAYMEAGAQQGKIVLGL